MSEQPASSGGQLSGAWNIAKKAASTLGYTPTSFSVAVRSLLADHFENNASLRPVTKYQVSRLLKGPTFLAMLYYATKSLRGEALKDRKQWTVGHMMDVFTPLDVATLISSFVFYRKAKKQLKDKHWGTFEPLFVKEPLFGAYAGAYVPEIGVGQGIMMACFRYISLAAISLRTPDDVKKVTTLLNDKGRQCLPIEEEKLFGCSSSQVAVFLMSQMGYGPVINNSYTMALDDAVRFSDIADKYALSMRMASLWIEGLLKGLDQPAIKIPAQFFPRPAEHEILKKKLAAVRGGEVAWLHRTKDDVSPEKTPEISAKVEGAEEIPEQLRDVFTMEDITNMEEEDFDDLIDQIDEENEGKKSKHANVLDSKDLKDLESMVE